MDYVVLSLLWSRPVQLGCWVGNNIFSLNLHDNTVMKICILEGEIIQTILWCIFIWVGCNGVVQFGLRYIFEHTLVDKGTDAHSKLLALVARLPRKVYVQHVYTCHTATARYNKYSSIFLKIV